MSEQERAPKRIIPMNAPQHRIHDANIVVTPSISTLLEDALSVISSEILRFKHKSGQGKALDLAESRVLQGYIKSLTELAKESREREDDMDLANATDEELLKLVEQMKSKKETKP